MQKGLNIISTKDVTIAKLYNTTVAIIGPKSMWLSHGGWVTQSTAKAINQALAKAGQDNWRCYRKLGAMYITNGNITQSVEQVNIDDKLGTMF